MKAFVKRYHLNVLLLLLSGTLYWSCLEEVEPYGVEPSVKVRFFNIDSLTKINEAIAQVDTLTKHLNAEKTALATSLSALNASLANLNQQITDGMTELIPERDAVQAQITEATDRRAAIDVEVAALASSKAPLSKAVAAINSGDILLNRIIANGNEISFEDSATVFRLPLNMGANSQVYYFDIAGKTDSLELTYDFVEEVTSKSYIRLTGVNVLATEKFSFDSVQVYCRSLPDPCPSNETTVNVYF